MATTKTKSNKEDFDSDDDDDFLSDPRESDAEKLDLRIVSWNLEGAEDVPSPKDLMAIAYTQESKSVHVYALQEVKCLEKLRDALWTCIGGSSRFELFEHWMGKAGAGFSGQTVLLVFAPKDLCTTGRFRLSRFANSQVKREIQRGNRFKLLGGTTSSRGAVGIPFTFLDTTFSLVSVRLVEEESEKNLEQQQRDLDKILELCRMKENAETNAAGSLHHAFLCGSFRAVPKGPESSSSSSNHTSGSALNGSSNSPTRKSISTRFSFVRRQTTSKPNSSMQLAAGDAFAQTRQLLPALESFEEMDSSSFAFEPDHIFYKSATGTLEKCLEPLSGLILSTVRAGRPPVTCAFRLTGKGSNILTSWSRLSGNLPLQLSSRSNVIHAKNDVAQRPRISTATQLKRERGSRSGTQDMLGGPGFRMQSLDEKYILECTKCEAPINDSENIVPVTKDGCAYHARCFCCDHCGVSLCPSPSSLSPGESLPDVSFHEVDGQLLCQNSFETLYVKCCEACGGSLGDEFLTLPGLGASSDLRRFHISCFKCGVCMRPFATKVLMGDIIVEAAIPHDGMYLCEADFARVVGGVKCCICEHSFDNGIKIDGEIYCQRDFNDLFSGGNCALCQTPVTDSQALTLSPTDKSHAKRACHVDCLKCATCQRKIPELNQSFLEYEGQIFCQDDWVKKQSTLVFPNCSRCKLPVKENRVDALDSTFHPACFVCTFCNVNLAGVKFYASEGKIWCLNDYERFCCSDLPACPSCHRTVGSADKAKAQQLGALTWHGDCFVCGRCGTGLKGRKSKLLKGKLHCEKC